MSDPFMTQSPKKIQEIQEALEAATPGPWYSQDNEDTWQLFGGHLGVMQLIKAPKYGTDYAEYWPTEADSQLIANAPEWLRYLLEENKKLVESVEWWQNSYMQERELCKGQKEHLQSQLKSEREQNQILIEGLKWYGDESNYGDEEYPDKGERARTILKELGI